MANGRGSGAPVIVEAVLAQLVSDLGAADVASLCSVFLADASELLVALRAAYDSGDAAALAHGAHRLKSASGFVGAETVSRTARRLEHLAREPEREAVAPLLDVLAEELEQLSDQLVPVVLRLPRDPRDATT